MSSHSWHYSHSHSHNWHSRTFSIVFRFWLLWIEHKYSSDPLLWWWWPIQSYLHTWIYEYQSSRTRVGQVIPPRSKVRKWFGKGFCFHSRPCASLRAGGGPKDGIMGLLYSSDGHSQNVEGKLRQNEIFSNRSKGQRERFLRIWHFY